MRNNHPKQQLHTISKVETISYPNYAKSIALFLPRAIIETYFPQICLVEIYYLSLFSIILQTPPPVENTKTNL